MSVFQLGIIIKERREELGISQEILADGICAVPTLSRIENGERIPTKTHFEMLMQRLGYSAVSLDFFTDKQDFQAYELKFKIRQAYIEKDYNLAKVYVEELETLLPNPTNVDKQFLCLYRILLNQKYISNSNRLAQLEAAIRLTCPKYESNYIPRVLSYDEIILLNNIAICHEGLGNRELAITILFVLKEYYDQHIINREEALRTQPLILYNLSKYLGLSKRYDECIEVCKLGIQIARTTGRCSLLAETLFNYAWVLIQRGREEDREKAEVTLRQAISLSHVMDNRQIENQMQDYYREIFGKSVLV